MGPADHLETRYSCARQKQGKATATDIADAADAAAADAGEEAVLAGTTQVRVRLRG